MKILILGERNTGKSTYVQTLLKSNPIKNEPTQGIVLSNINILTNKGEFPIEIYDCSTPINTNIHGNDIIGVFLFIDISTGCDNLDTWISYAKKYNNVILIGNKQDITQRTFSEVKLEKYFSNLNLNIFYVPVSSYERLNIENPIIELLRLYFKDVSINFLNYKSAKDEILI